MKLSKLIIPIGIAAGAIATITYVSEPELDIGTFELETEDCESTLTTRSSTEHCNFIIGESSNPVLFDWCSGLDGGTVYPNPDPTIRKPYYGGSGWGHWTFFGDGRYSWDEEPLHTYESSGTYSHVYTEKTPIKNGGGPPPAINELDQDEIIVCMDGRRYPDENNHFDGEEQGIAFDESRPPYCGYTFVQIIRFKINERSSANELRIRYNSRYFGPPDGMFEPFVLPYKNQPYEFVRIDSRGEEKEIILDVTRTPRDKEYPICIQFQTKCDYFEDEYESEICAELINEHDEVEMESCTRKLVDSRLRPFDPNWIEPRDPFGFNQNNCRSIPALAYFYYQDKGRCTDRGVKLSITAGRNVVELRATKNRSVNSNYSLIGSNKGTTLEYKSKSKFLKGVECIREDYSKMKLSDVLDSLHFNFVVNPIGVNDKVSLILTSEFDDIEPYSKEIFLNVQSYPDPLCVVKCPRVKVDANTEVTSYSE